ncbi:hypothetical protein WAF17_20805 [Bernardetia sp. ABR2-2B]|uniref:hypothetical protein n=1 Tax=Bernardetia sp. ABR2-2B TaxID=3127472 RepID=UPI0030CD3023
MTNKNLFSYKPENSNQKIWQVYPDPKSEFIVLEIREKQKQKYISQLLVLDTEKEKVFAIAEMEATQTLVNFFDKTILLSEIDFQNEMPIAKGLQALNMDFETIWELEEVSYYGIWEEKHQTQNIEKVIFSLQENYYSVPLKLDANSSKEEVEASQENYNNLQSKIKQYFYSTQEYSTNHINYKDIASFILEKAKHKVKESIFYVENDNYLVCSFLVEYKENKFKNYLLCTDRKGIIQTYFLIKDIEKEGKKNPQELILMKNKILWIDENEFHFLSI